ncbi:MAG: DUF3737 family protein [Ruminococcaceae bacterium]|nr:DUF3737 family protein [Oscillospiraceae bacterium]
MIYSNKTFDEERALYNIEDSIVTDCIFDGPADGESALKECSRITVENCDFRLRYPFWHVTDGHVKNCKMSDTCRAALWYDQNMIIEDSVLGGIKALRECHDITMKNCEMVSEEFGWRCSGLKIENCTLTSMYPFFECKEAEFDKLTLNGKYSFQYLENAHLRNCELRTKDAFWHCKNVTVEDSLVQGEYLAWYSENLKLVRCKIVGTQPLCYCKGLILEDCEMVDADFAFENSEVEATVNSHIISVKNPISGFIKAESIGEIILDTKREPKTKCDIISLK